MTGESGKARDDVLAALGRRGWAGRLVWAFAPVQDRHAAPAIVRALGDLAALGRGGGRDRRARRRLAGRPACFCDETLCRTVALLRVPVIASVGHHTDRTLLDDVAAVSCSTPTHAAEAAVAIDCTAARRQQQQLGSRLRDRSRRCSPSASAPGQRAAPAGPRAPRRARRARWLALLSRAPGTHIDRQRERLHQQLREIRAGRGAGWAASASDTGKRALVSAAQGRARRSPTAAGAAPRELRAARAGAGGPRSPADARARLRARSGPRRRAVSLGARGAGGGRAALRFADGAGGADERTER